MTPIREPLWLQFLFGFSVMALTAGIYWWVHQHVSGPLVTWLFNKWRKR